MAFTKKAKKKSTEKSETGSTKKATKKPASEAKSTKKTGSSSVKSHLRKLQNSYKKAEVMGAKAPEGDWDARIDKFELRENNGALRAVWTCKGLDSGQESQRYFISCGLDTEQQLGFLKGIFTTLGVTPPRDIMQLETVAEEETVGLDVQVNVQHNDQWVNTNFVKVLGDGSDTVEYVKEPAEKLPEIKEGPAFSVGDPVKVKIEGAYYAGKITEVREDKAHVEFEDGDSGDVDLDQIEYTGDDGAASTTPEATGEYSAAEVGKMSEDDLEDLVDKHDLEMDIDDHDTLKEQRKAVVAKLEEDGLLAG